MSTFPDKVTALRKGPIYNWTFVVNMATQGQRTEPLLKIKLEPNAVFQESYISMPAVGLKTKMHMSKLSEMHLECSRAFYSVWAPATAAEHRVANLLCWEEKAWPGFLEANRARARTRQRNHGPLSPASLLLGSLHPLWWAGAAGGQPPRRIHP